MEQLYQHFCTGPFLHSIIHGSSHTSKCGSNYGLNVKRKTQSSMNESGCESKIYNKIQAKWLIQSQKISMEV